jgi:peptidoglycan/xylan/chitin deacetylase (PgdA/CDA1 family)
MPPALLYHAVRDVPEYVEARSLFVAPDRFAWQLGQLAVRGYGTLSLAEHRAAVLSGVELPGRLLITFDDALADTIEVVTPLLERHGFSAAMFVPAAHIADSNAWDAPRIPTMSVATANELAEAARGPWELGSHGYAHLDLRALESPERARQLVCAREELTEIAGAPVDALAYPFGLEDAAVRLDARAAGYTMAFTAGRGERSDPFRLPRRPVRGQEGDRAFVVKVLAGLDDAFD